MKICFVISTLLSGGAERNVCFLANNFLKKNDISIITFQKNKNSFYKLNSKIKVINLNLLKNVNNFLYKLYNFFIRVMVIRRKFKEEKPDVIISFLETMNITVLLASLFLSNIKIKIISDRNDPTKEKNFIFLFFLKFIIYRTADYLVLQTKDIIKKYNFYPKKKIVLIKNTISNQIKIKKNYNIGNKFKILCIGRLEVQKSYLVLFEALKLLKKKNIKFVCDIYGSGSKKNDLKNYLFDHNLNADIFLKGSDKNLLNKIKKYDFYILSSSYEGYPNSLLECMSTGLACISSDCNYGPREIIKNNVNGILFKTSDYFDLLKKIIHLVERPYLIKKLGLAAQKSFKYNEFNKKSLEKWKKIIKV